MKCREVQKNLVDYHQGKLPLDQYKQVNQHLSSCTRCAAKLNKLVNDQTSFIKKMKWKRLFIVVALLTMISVGVYYFSQANPNQAAYGDVVDISIVDEDIQFAITHVAADDDQTIFYYELKNLKEDEHYFIEENSPIFLEETTSIIVDEKMNGITKGRIYTDPIATEEEKVLLNVILLFQTDEELNSSEWYSTQNRSYIEGNWQLEIPVKKYETKTYDLKATTEIDGVTVHFDQLKLNPTSTVLTYSYYRDQSNQHNRDIRLSHLNAKGKRYDAKGYYHHDSEEQFTQSIFFESMYYQDLKSFEVHFGKMTKHIADQVKVDFDYKELPFTFEYLGEQITIERVDVNDEQTEIVITEKVNKDRSYNALYLDLDYYRFSGQTSFEIQSQVEGVWVDREGKVYHHLDGEESLTNYRYFSTEQTINVKAVDGNEQFIPTFVFVDSYSKETLLDDVIHIKIK